MIICAVFDEKMGEYMNPFGAVTPGSAIRAFSDEVKRADSPVSRHPDDYTLFQLGYFDQQSGELTSERKLLLKASEV